jgi:5-methylcytosine-specific restriction endonuclease McrA
MKLTPEQVAEIKASTESGVALAARHGVSPSKISTIRAGAAAAEKAREYSREYRRKRRLDPEFKKRDGEALKRWMPKPGNAEKSREASRQWSAANPEKVRDAGIRRRADPAHRAYQREASRKWLGEPKNRKIQRGRSAEFQARQRAASVGAPVLRDRAVTDFYEFVATAANAPCAYCGIDSGPERRQVDHKTPRARGGSHAVENLAVACGKCNRDKSTMTADEYLASLAYKTKSSTTR